MNSSIKAVGAILALALALTAVVTAASSADEEEGLTADGPMTLVMQQNEVGNLFMTMGQKFTCPGSIYTGHKYNVTPHVPIPANSNQVTVTPHYKNCTVNGNKATVTMNGCDFELKITFPAPGMFRLQGFIACPKGKSIVEDTYASPTSETLKLCEITTGAQELSGEPTIEETESGHLAIKGAFEGIHSESSGLCGSSTSTEGVWELNLTVEGLNEGEEETALGLS